MQVYVGSLNPSQIWGVEQAIREDFPDADVDGYKVSSGVTSQPKSVEEAQQGAYNRVAALIQLFRDADMAVGVEGGIFPNPFCPNEDMPSWFYVEWVIVAYRSESLWRYWMAGTPAIPIPPEISMLVAEGNGLGQACDIAFAGIGTKLTHGLTGLLSMDRYTQSGAIREATRFALNRLIHPTMFCL